jgi:hypothetical protein
LIEDLGVQLEAAKKAQLDKLEKSKAHLVMQLETASEKYLTVNGYMQARTTIDQCAFGEDTNDSDAVACLVAREMSELAGMLAENIEATDVFNLGTTIIDGHLVTNFVDYTPIQLINVVRQLLVVNLLQNAGPVLDDILSFRESTSEQIALVEAELAKHAADATEPEPA